MHFVDEKHRVAKRAENIRILPIKYAPLIYLTIKNSQLKFNPRIGK
ncbi:hypothetical protein HMPREF0758_4625 [Serratia odorifera DSM 4582]|uniref:Uncharacterized protein n=1 Tax=Serratia odorifera DSM 4582 TaxID=667129 RepID=D4E8X5_SEROD|nr:hypothetical protein HMPREF0758_4625 [Serratia odorifera DSM 4582]